MTDFEQFGENIHDRPKIGKSLGLKEYDFPKLNADILAEKYAPKQISAIKKILQFLGAN